MVIAGDEELLEPRDLGERIEAFYRPGLLVTLC